MQESASPSTTTLPPPLSSLPQATKDFTSSKTLPNALLGGQSETFQPVLDNVDYAAMACNPKLFYELLIAVLKFRPPNFRKQNSATARLSSIQTNFVELHNLNKIEVVCSSNEGGTLYRSCLRHYATSWKISGSITEEVWIFQLA
jgi:hypothetical protein